ncbi:MAG: hypothetical protein FWB78_07215 [Treponema sp.]|nr:hypothetical protein [Treponema sp.]
MIVKARHTSDFLQMNNSAAQDPALSWAARGLLACLLSFPPTWEVRLTDLIKRGPDGRTRTEAAMNELIKAGYVKKEQGENKRKDTKYTVFEVPPWADE